MSGFGPAQLATMTAFISSRRSCDSCLLRFQLAALPAAVPPPPAAVLATPTALASFARTLSHFLRIATWLVPFANLYAGHDNSLSLCRLAIPACSSLSLSLPLYLCDRHSSACLACWLPHCLLPCLPYYLLTSFPACLSYLSPSLLPCLSSPPGAFSMESARFVPALL